MYTNTPLSSKVITITSIEDQGNKIAITDENNIKYSFFKLKQDGSESNAYNTFLNANHGGRHTHGTVTKIGYKEDTKQNQYGKSVTYRTIVSFLGGVQAPEKKAQPESNSSVTEPSDNEFWDKKAYKQCLWNYWLEQVKDNPINTPNWKNMVWDIFKEIEADAEKRFAKGWKKAEAMYEKEELPVIQQETMRPDGRMEMQDVPPFADFDDPGESEPIPF